MRSASGTSCCDSGRAYMSIFIKRGDGSSRLLLLLLAWLLVLEWRWCVWSSSAIAPAPPAVWAPAPIIPSPFPPPVQRCRDCSSWQNIGRGVPKLARSAAEVERLRPGLWSGPDVMLLLTPELDALDTLCRRFPVELSAGHSKCTQWNTWRHNTDTTENNL